MGLTFVGTAFHVSSNTLHATVLLPERMCCVGQDIWLKACVAWVKTPHAALNLPARRLCMPPFIWLKNCVAFHGKHALLFPEKTRCSTQVGLGEHVLEHEWERGAHNRRGLGANAAQQGQVRHGGRRGTTRGYNRPFYFL